ncbi:MAG: methyltransferase domain-containing protein [Candidatus Melainabacteria bacterium]
MQISPLWSANQVNPLSRPVFGRISFQNNNSDSFKRSATPDPTALLINSYTQGVLHKHFVNDIFRHDPELGHIAWQIFIKRAFESTLNNSQASSLNRTSLATHSNIFDQVGQYLDEQPHLKMRLEQSNLKWHEGRTKALSRQILDSLEPVISGLPRANDFYYIDLGCGEAHVTKAVAAGLNLLPSQVLPLEIDSNSTSRYQQQEWEIATYDGKQIPKEFAKADLITLLSVLHHTENDQAAQQLLTQVYQQLKPGGIAVIREIDASSDLEILYARVRHSILQKIAKSTSPNMPRDQVYHSKGEWKTIVKDVGFQVISDVTDESMKSNNLCGSFNLVLKKPL